MENSLDIGAYVTKNASREVKCQVLEVDFSLTATARDTKYQKRAFRQEWLRTYSPWLCYSNMYNGPFCKYCVLFPQPVHRGLQGAFIKTPCTRYNDFHTSAKQHLASEWHKNAIKDASSFMKSVSNPSESIVCKIDQSIEKTIDENKRKLIPIISSIIFCATHDIALRGKESFSGNMMDLLQFRVEAGDTELENHLLTAPKNASYTSHRVQNDLIAICEKVLVKELVKKANESAGFSILADETADISGKEQLAVGIRFVDYNTNKFSIREELLGFVMLTDFKATEIAAALLDFCKNSGLNMGLLIGQGYDGCSAMAGKDGGVQAIIRRDYPKAAFVHCASHRLNLVINDLNAVPGIRNTIGTIKAIIKFFVKAQRDEIHCQIYHCFVKHGGVLNIRAFEYFVSTFQKFSTS